MAYCKFHFDGKYNWKNRPFSVEGDGSATGREHIHKEDGYYVETEIDDIEPVVEDLHCYWDDNDIEFTEEEYSEFEQDKAMDSWLYDIMIVAASDSENWEID